MFKIKKVQLVRATGTDQISIEVEGPTPFPELDAREPGKYPPTMRVETRRGYAEEWLTGMGISMADVEVIDTSQLRRGV